VQKLSENEKGSPVAQSISSILDKCITIEKYTHNKYKELSKQTENEQAKILFDELSRAGEAHALMLKEIHDSLTTTGEILNTVNISAHLEIPEKEDIPHESGVEQTYYAMKKHLTLESDFKEIYTKLSEVENPVAKELFRLLIIDETNHHKKLKDLIKSFEEVYKLLFSKKL